MRLLAPALLAATVLTACGPSTHPTPPPGTPRPSPSPSPTPTPLPDVHTIDITATGVGSYQLIAFPVAVLHSNATRDMATGVVVHFTTTRSGRPQFSLDSEAVELFPGQSLIVTADCTDPCFGADGATATVTATTWAAATGSPITVTPATYACTNSCRGHGQGDATATVHGAGIAASARIYLFADCQSADGSIVGGGSRTVIWSQAGADEQLDVPVIVSAQPATCTINATPASATPSPTPAASTGSGGGSSPSASGVPKPTPPTG